MARKDTGRTFNVAVVGVSGTEKEKGQVGVGKSCLCNRFVRSLADDYYVEHISVLSQTDFSGRVVNNDHFLYWGDAYKVSDEGVEFHFQVIEQTEFIDDASFQPFKGGKMEPYVKRCANTKLTSAEKLMYICKNQLGIEKEYDQKVLPDGKTNIDGFLVTMDVSVVPSRPIERQVEFVAVVLNNLMKTKKPIVVASTKHDEACDAFVREVEKLLSRKEYKNSIPLVETSAHENVNVDLAFLVLAQHIDRNKGRTRIIPYAEAARNLKETLDVATDAYQRLIRQQITDYRALWSSSSKRLAEHPEYQHYVELFGADQAVKLFRKHVKKLKDEHLALKIKKYMDTLPAILQEMFPDIPSLGSGDWETVKEKMQAHPDFSRYFLDTPADFSWVEADMLDLGDGRIPFDVLDTNEAEMVYLGHVNNLQRDQRKVENKIRFKQLLEETGYVTPGKSLSEVQVLFMGRDCFESLSEADCQQIYDQHQRELIDKSKQNLQELLLEHAHLFYQIRASALPGNYSWEDFKEVTASLEEDSRYKALDRLESERRLLLLQHVGFVHCPKREHCPAYPRCIDAFIEEVLAANPRRGTLNSNNPWSSSLTSNPLNLILLGARGLAQDLSSTLRQVCVDDEIEVDGHFFSLDYRVVNEQVSLPHYLLQSSDFVPQGCICVYSDASSLEYVRENLESTLLSNLEREDGLPFQGLPIVLLWVPDLSVPGPERANLRLEGLNLADSLLCPFIDSTETEQPNNAKLEDSDVHRAIKALVLSIEQKTGFPTLSQHSNYQAHHQSTLPHRTMDSAPPDIRVIMCMLCGDPYMLESVLGPFLSHPGCVQTGERSFSLSTFLGDAKRKVEVVVSSYHGAGAFRDELVHGFILVYSTKRKASLATLSAFSYNIPNLPIQIVAVTESGGASAFFNSEISHQLITAGNAAADRLQAHFMTITANAQNKTGFYAPFLKDVWDKKLEIEQAFRLEDSGTLHDSGEGTLERPFRPPPPPRNDSFRHARSNEEYDESDIYECLPTDGSPGEDLDDSLSPTCLDDRHISSSDDSGEMFSALNPEVPTTNLALARKSNGEHLVKPSQLKSGKLRHGFQVFPSPSTPPEPAPPDRDPIRDRASFFPRWPLKAAVASSLPTSAASKNNVETEEPNPELLCLQQQPKGWLDDFMFMRRTDPQAEAWNSSSTSYAYKAFTTGRRKHPAPHGSAHYGREAGTTTKQPGRLKMEEYNNVTDAIARMKLGSRASGAKEVPPPLPPPRQKVPPPVPTGPAPSAGVAPLAFPECEDFESGVDSSQLLEDSRGSYPSYAEGDYAYGATGSFDAGTGANSKMRSRQRREKGRPSYSDTDSDLSSMERRQRDSLRPRKASSHKRTRRKRGAIPVAPPRVPPPPLSAGSVGTPGKPYSFPVPGVPLPLAARCAGLDVSAPEKGQYRPLQDEDSSLDVSSPRDLGEGSPLFHTHGRGGVISEALRASQHRRDKSKSKEEDKHEKRRLKEEERQKKAANKERKRKSKSGGGSGAKGGGAQVLPTLEQLMEAEGRCVPLFIEKCITFIEEEGLDSEGIYRVPGNRAHVDMLFARFEEDPNCSIRELDIAVNAVATALKDYFSKRLPPVLSPDQMEELEDISLTSDRSCRLLALRSLLKKLSPVSFNLLKYIFQHFVRVAENCKANSMDSKNLAICWWPTLLPFEFTDMGRFECMRPHIEDTVQAMIDQFPFLFLGKEDVVMV